MLIALTREVSPAITQCELTHLERQPIDYALACKQHSAYQAALEDLGCKVDRLISRPDMPDSVFIEDTAIVLDEIAIITRPGADSRKRETASVARALEAYRRLCFIETPGTVDGGDVLCIGKTLYVGLSSRSNQAAIEQMQGFLAPYGYTVKGVTVTGCLHLKSAVAQAAQDTLLINRNWVDPAVFGDMKLIDVDPAEPYAANVIFLSSGLLYPTSFPRTREKLAALGARIKAVDVSELQKAEGAVTCCSLIFNS